MFQRKIKTVLPFDKPNFYFLYYTLHFQHYPNNHLVTKKIYLLHLLIFLPYSTTYIFCTILLAQIYKYSSIKKRKKKIILHHLINSPPQPKYSTKKLQVFCVNPIAKKHVPLHPKTRHSKKNNYNETDMLKIIINIQRNDYF